jgi:hypothetical protein
MILWILLCTFGFGATIDLDDSFYDPKMDYSNFSGRISDKDDTGQILKISSENKNIKFFRAGDLVNFTISNSNSNPCHGSVRSVEPGYFVIYVKDFEVCGENAEFFRRGSALVFKSDTLQDRIKTMSNYRVTILRRKDDFLQQLNGINNFLWTYDQKKVLVAADYDKKIAEMDKEKSKAVDFLQDEREDKIKLRKELIKRIDNLNRDLEYYRISKDELFDDRWHLDLNMGLPVKERPQAHKDY